jgi:hypothetical protein
MTEKEVRNSRGADERQSRVRRKRPFISGWGGGGGRKSKSSLARSQASFLRVSHWSSMKMKTLEWSEVVACSKGRGIFIYWLMTKRIILDLFGGV